MRINFLSFAMMSLFGVSTFTLANDYPLEFADFFEQHVEEVDVVLIGSLRSKAISAQVSYDFFQLLSGGQSKKKLKEYLQSQRLTSSAISSIIEQLSKGIKANPGCDERLDVCVPKDIPGQAEFVFDFDMKQLRIFVSTEMLSFFAEQKEYVSPVNSHQALINWSNLYFYASDDSQTINWNNETSLGLPLGYIALDTRYHQSSDENEFDVFRAIYSYEKEAIRAVVGYQDQNAIALNSTDVLSYGANFSGFSASLGSSSNLFKGSQLVQQRLYFYASQGGQLEVYQGSRLLFSRVVSAGEQSVGYDQLPTGTYQVTIRLKQGEQILLEEQRLVVNNQSFRLPVSDWDYRLEVGKLDDERFLPAQNRSYARGLVSYRPLESLMASSGLLGNGEAAQALVGLNWSAYENIHAQYTLGQFFNGDQYQFAQLFFAPFSFSARTLAHNNLERPSDLTRLLYGEDDINEYSFSVSGNWIAGQTFINYSHFETVSPRTKSESDNVSLTWLHPLWGGGVSLNANYSLNQFDNESLSVGLSWRRQFGSELSSSSGITFDKNGLSQAQSSVTKSYRGDDWNASSTLGVRHYEQSNNTIGEGLFSANGSNDFMRYEGFAYLSTDSGHSLSGSLSGTQIVTLQEAIATNKRSQSFVALEPHWNEEGNNNPLKVNYVVTKNQDYWYRDVVEVGERRLVDLPIYTEVDFTLDVESKRVDASEVDGRLFTLPGTYHRINNEVTPILSQVFILNDMNGDPVRFVRCLGKGCGSVETLSDDGVFRLNFKRNRTFKLVSNRRMCVYDPDRIGERYIQAYCLPGLDSSEGQLVRKEMPETDIPQLEDEQPLLYIGKYEMGEATEEILARLTKAGLTSKSINVGGERYVYVRYQDVYTSAQRALLETLDAYVILDPINTKQLFTSR